MGDMMAAESASVSLVVSIGAAIASGIVVLSFWMNLSDRITKADTKASDALQDAAEAKNENDNLRDAIAEMTRNIDERIDRSRREEGESLLAIRQHVTELALYMRDNFARKDELNVALTEIKAGQVRLETKLDRMSDHMRA